jgi:hypothetical protein
MGITTIEQFVFSLYIVYSLLIILYVLMSWLQLPYNIWVGRIRGLSPCSGSASSSRSSSPSWTGSASRRTSEPAGHARDPARLISPDAGGIRVAAANRPV